MGNTLSQGIEIPAATIDAAVLLFFGVTVIVSVLSAWIPVRRASRLPAKSVVLGIMEEAQTSNRPIIGTGIVLLLISEILPEAATGNTLYIADGLSLLGLIIATIFTVAGPKIPILPELDFMTFLSAGAMGVLTTLTGPVVPTVESKKMKLVERIKFKQPEDLKMKPITGNIAIEGKNIAKNSEIGEAATRALRNVSLGILKGGSISIMGQFDPDGKKPKDYREQLDNILEIAGLSDRRKHTPRELSGGQQQRAAVIRVLISDSEILFVDESAGNLDSKTGAEIMKLLQSINKNSGRTITMVTHSPETAKNNDRIIAVKDGTIEQLCMI